MAAQPATVPSPDATTTIDVRLKGRDELHLQFDVQGGVVCNAKLKVIGCPEILRLAVEWRSKLKGPLESLPLPEGLGHADLLLREAILKAQGKWQFPYSEDELCHCRAVPTEIVDCAIVAGAHTVSAVSRKTSAGTSCGTCQVDIENVLRFRLNRGMKKVPTP